MAKKPSVTTVASGYFGRQALNDNFEALRDAFDNTLSRDGSTPNAMGADLDMNSNDILNTNEIATSSLRINGVLVSPADLSTAGSVMYSNKFTGDGSTVAYTMSYDPYIKDNTLVYIDGVYQNKDGYAISGTTLTFSEAPPLNSSVEIVVARTLQDVGTADAAAVTYSQGGTGAVTTTVENKLQEFVSVKDFGAVGDGVTDDTAAIQAALDSGKKVIFFPEGTYIANDLTATGDDFYLFGGGIIQFTTKGLTMSGNTNRIDGLKFTRAAKSTNPSMVYTNHGISISGTYNSITNVEVSNCDGCGISVAGGFYITLHNVNCHDNITGMILRNTARQVYVTDSHFNFNDVNNASGADGVLFNRNAEGVYFTNCSFNYNGEHGVYGQGQTIYITNCRALGNHGNGFKFGSYDDQINTPGSVWVPGAPGVPGLDGVVGANGYGVRDVVIHGCRTGDNGQDDGIYFQPSAKDVVISSNICENDNIKTAFFNTSGARLEAIQDFIIEGNRLTGTGCDIIIAASSGISVLNNYTDGQIYTNAPDSATAPEYSQSNSKPVIIGNTANDIFVNRAASATVQSNQLVDFYIASNSSGAIIKDNIITGMDESLLTNRIAAFTGNTVTVVGNIAFNSDVAPFSFPKEFIGNSITGNSYTSSYFISASLNANAPDYGRFCNNYIEATGTTRPVELEGEYCTFTGNVIINDGTDERAVDCFGDNMTITGNVVKGAKIHLRNDTANIVVGNKVSSVTEDGSYTTNIIANNG